MNECFFAGRLTRDPELKQVGSQGTAVVTFSIAVNREYKNNSGEKIKEVVFVELEAWDSGAETINRHFKKGSGIIVKSSYRPNKWTDKDGNNRLSPRFRVEKFWFPPSDSTRTEPANSGVETSGESPANNDGDIPF